MTRARFGVLLPVALASLLAVLVLTSGQCYASVAQPLPRNLIIISVDTLNSDVMSGAATTYSKSLSLLESLQIIPESVARGFDYLRLPLF